MVEGGAVSLATDRQSIHGEMDRAAAQFHAWTTEACRSDLRRRTDGTRWTKAQMLFHMLFGYLIVLRLLRLVRLFGRVPERYSRAFAGMLDGGTRAFHVVNYLGSCGGALVFHGPQLLRLFDRVVASLHARLDAESEHDLALTMHFPVGWDPVFQDSMTLLEVYHYGTQHFDFHARQLTLPGAPGRDAP